MSYSQLNSLKPQTGSNPDALRAPGNRLKMWETYLPVRACMLALCLSFFITPFAAAESLNGFKLDDPLIPVEKILPGGPQKDGIFALDRLLFVPATDASFMQDTNRVIGVEFAGETRAYPAKILNYHEVVNDRINGESLLISYCPLCGTGMVFHAETENQALNFGASGLLYNRDVLLYDKQTESLWSQSLGQAVSGPMKGARLERIAVSHTSWSDWKNRHPDTVVLLNHTGYKRSYDIDPYAGYDRTSRAFSPVSHTDHQYMRKALMVGLEINGKFKAYLFKELRNSPPEFKDQFASSDITIQFDRKNKTARALDHKGEEIPTVIASWYAWYAFHPETEIYSASKSL